MSRTPEGKVKDRLKKFFKEIGDDAYLFWPMQNGMGAPALDVHGAFKGRAFAIEVKAGNKDMTARQKATAEKMRKSGARVFLINETPATWHELRLWIAQVSLQVGDDNT